MTNPPSDKVSFGYAKIGDVNFHYAKAGEGKKLILLLHGFPDFWYSWRYQLAELSDEYTIIAPDTRGYNLSDQPSEVSDYEIDKLVEDQVGLIKHFGFEKAFVVGHDWGAGIAWALANNKPEYVEKLVCLQVPHPAAWKRNQTIKQFFASWYMFFFQLPRIPEWTLTRDNFAKLVIALKTSTVEKGVFTKEDIAAYRKAWAKGKTVSCSLNYYRANIIQRLFSKGTPARKISVPTLFIYGEQDHAILPETVKGVGDFVEADYEEIRFSNAGHWVHNEAEEDVTRAIREFVSK